MSLLEKLHIYVGTQMRFVTQVTVRISDCCRACVPAVTQLCAPLSIRDGSIQNSSHVTQRDVTQPLSGRPLSPGLAETLFLIK